MEHEIIKQINDKERIAATMENPKLTTTYQNYRRPNIKLQKIDFNFSTITRF